MREVTFLNQNSNRWKETEQYLNHTHKADPDKLADLFVQLTDDLAYARTYFPSSQTTKYLNQLTIQAHQKLYTTKKFNLHRIYTFFTYDYPILIYKNYRFLLYSFLIFLLSAMIGALSAANDEQFVRLILGDGYVNETLENIEKGNPLRVYEKMNALPMFLAITFNNIKVALLAFALGAFASLGTGFILFQNGIMLGAFQYFFHSKHLLTLSAMGIWMHGTIEIFSIVVAGAAGLTMGNSLLFPGTYKRKTSFQKGAMQGIKMVFGLIPFFIIAGFIEGYLTRHHEIQWLSLGIIGASVMLIIFYFFIYPITQNRTLCKNKST